jgi:hypothetical protein
MANKNERNKCTEIMKDFIIWNLWNEMKEKTLHHLSQIF